MFKKYFAMLLAVPVLIGCGRGPTLTEVEGVVKVKGQPASKIEVEFWPESSGPRSFGITDEQGKFTLVTDDKKARGAVPGKHRIVLRDHEVLGDKLLGRAGENVDMTEGRKSRISPAYADPLRSPLTAEVTSEKKSIDFDAEPNNAQAPTRATLR